MLNAIVDFLQSIILLWLTYALHKFLTRGVRALRAQQELDLRKLAETMGYKRPGKRDDWVRIKK